jgi:hypothetical protein
MVFMIVTMTLCGCSGLQPFPRSETDAQLFGPVSMRLHPIFTQVKDWTGDGKARRHRGAGRVAGSVRRSHQGVRPDHL